MKFRKFSIILSSMALLITSFGHAASSAHFGVVNFTTCVMESKLGKKEQQSFESLKNQMTTLVTDVEKQMKEIQSKLSDPDYLDTLSPEGEQELRTKLQALNEDMARYQNQYMQIMNQANMRLVQSLSSAVAEASTRVAEKENLTFVLNRDSCFYYDPKSDVTQKVISQMDKDFEMREKQQRETSQVEESAESQNNG